jgi:hypothetical protein
MSALKGIIRNGQVIVIGPTDLPDGTEVEILPAGLLPVDDQVQMTPDEITRTLAAMDKTEPFEMTDPMRKGRPSRQTARPARNGKRLNSMSTPTGFGGSGSETLPL